MSGTTVFPAVSVECEIFGNSGKPIPSDLIFCPPPVIGADRLLRFELASSGSRHVGTKGFVGAYEPEPGVFDGWMRIRWSGPGRLTASAEVLGVSVRPVGCPPVICLRPSYVYKSDALVQAVAPAQAFRAPVVIGRISAHFAKKPKRGSVRRPDAQVAYLQGTMKASA